MKRILLVTDGLFHPPIRARRALHHILAELDTYAFTHIRSMEKLPDTMEQYSAVVLYLHHKQISDGSLAKLDAYLSSGGGLLGVHSATASYKKSDHFFEILGGRFIGHGPVEKFSVQPTGCGQVFQNIPSFEVKDELYIHETQPGIEVHFISTYQGEEIPVVWTRVYNKGRICYAGPGHRTQTMNAAAFQKILQQGLNWVVADEKN
jgi:type 1 glutamine amidotransferase